jgi:8-oxo-dGTP pyrophosphatase MutT (NUDIX family)
MSFTDWLARLEARVQSAPARPREPLCIGDAVCGSIEPELAQRMLAAGLPLRRDGGRWLLDGGDAALAALARWMHGEGLGGRWRDELMAVVDAAGTAHASVERAAVRPLGITTQAVHLVGTTAAGSVWVQQRAFDKATDPGQWDTLMGGLMSAGETVLQTLARETWEEAGLRIAELADVMPIGELCVRRPLPDGYMVERIHAFEAAVPGGVVPQNQDGEVECFECLPVPALIERLQAGLFTLEAALIHVRWLQRHGHPVRSG